MCFNRVGELPDSVEITAGKPDKSCNKSPPTAPASANGKAPTNCSSEGAASGFQTTFEGPLAREGSKRESNDLCARAEVNAEDKYQLELELEESSPVMESAFCRKVARDLRTMSFDCMLDEHRLKKPGGMERLTADESMTLAVDVACGVSPSGRVSGQSSRLKLNQYLPPSPNLVPALSNPRYPSNTRAPCAEVASDQPITTTWGIRSRNTSRKRIASRRISGKICVWAEVVKSSIKPA